MQTLAHVMHPEIDYSLVDLGMIKDVSVEEETIAITLNLPVAGVPIRDLLAQIARDGIVEADPNAHVQIQFATMNDEERAAFMRKAQEKWKL